jgi:elongation factor 2
VEDDYLPPHAKVEEEAPPPPAEGEEAEEEEAGEEAAKAPKKKEKNTMQERRIQSVMSFGVKTFNAVSQVPAGNMCALGGVDTYIVKRSSLIGTKHCFPFKGPFFLVSAVVKVSLSPKNAKELPKVVEGLRRLTKSCPLVEVSLEDSGLHAMSGCGQEHMRVLKNDLEEDYLPGIPLKWDDPSVSYRETVTAESSQICLSKSPNKHNRLFIKAEPMSEEVNLAIESNRINPMLEAKTRAKILDKEFGWDKTDALKIWGFGPAPEEAGGNYGANTLVDQTKGVQYLLEIKESMNSGLLWAGKQGPICEENMRGVRFNLLDVKLHTDSIHRGMGQIQPTARRVFFASVMMGQCRLVEPIFKAEIEATSDSSPGIMQALGACRGELVVSEDLPGSRVAVEAYVPIAETIGSTPFATVLSQKTNGKAAVSYAFDHWEPLPSDPLKVDPKKNTPQTKAAEIMFAIRTRKGLKVEPPILTDYLDKL